MGGKKNNTTKSDILPLAGVVRTVEVGEIEYLGRAALTWEEISAAVGSLRGGVWALPLILKGDAAITNDPPPPTDNLYLYRNMRSIGGIPELGNSLNTLGVRYKDFSPNILGQLKTDTDFVYDSSGEGMSVTPGYGNIISYYTI